MPYATFDNYTKDFYGDLIPQESFSKFEYKARIELDRFTFGRLKETKILPDEVRSCICELAEYLFKEDRKPRTNGISSETTDGYSVTYQTEKAISVISKDLYQIALKHLANTGLLYRGVGRC